MGTHRHRPHPHRLLQPQKSSQKQALKGNQHDLGYFAETRADRASEPLENPEPILSRAGKTSDSGKADPETTCP